MNCRKKLYNFYNITIIVLLLCTINLNFNYGYTINDDVEHKVEKRMDLESCIGQFDIQRDMIIRTEESRQMGAKFLDHADFDTRENCLRLCCESDQCDVFVFEEKMQGTCFLFHCGPSQNFRCKFTSHSNYTTAVLTPIKKKSIQIDHAKPTIAVFPIQPTVPNLSKHEMELTKLKEQINRDSIIAISSTIATTTTTNITPLEVRITESTSKIFTNSKHCGRFEFQCHSGECIAVYNACDGIPQCIDGSDEGLECPSTNINPSIKLPSISNNLIDGNQQQQPPLIQQSQQQYNNKDVQKDLVTIKQTIQGNNARQYIIGGASSSSRNREDPMTASKWANRLAATDQQYNIGDVPDSHIFNHKGGLQLVNNNVESPYYNGNNNGYGTATVQQKQQQQQQHRDSYGQSSISDQYSMAIQQWIPDTRYSQHWPQQQQQQQQPQSPLLPQPQQPQLQPISQIINLPKNAGDSNQQQDQLSLQQQEQHQQQILQPLQLQKQRQDQQLQPTIARSGQGNKFHLKDNDSNIQQQLPMNSGILRSSIIDGTGEGGGRTEDIVKNNIEPLNSISNDYNAVVYDDEINDNKLNNNNNDDSIGMITTDPPKKKIHYKHKKQQQQQQDKNKNRSNNENELQSTFNVIKQEQIIPKQQKSNSEQYKYVKSEYDVEFMDHDGAAERPGGAVLSLTLGLIATAALGILIGCRASGVKRRVRRHGKGPYAHDADFLVNGMYL